MTGRFEKEDMVRGKMRYLGVVALLMVVAVAFAGCEKVERARYEMVKLGFNKQTVKEIMKVKPTEETADTILYLPEADKGPLRVEFEFDKNGKLIKKEWLDRENL